MTAPRHPPAPGSRTAEAAAAAASPRPPLDEPYDPARVEPRWYAFWEAHGVFAASDSEADARPAYVVPMPPPNVTGSLHMGHALMTTLEDVLVRWHRMRGYNTLWQPGVDQAGMAARDGRPYPHASARARCKPRLVALEVHDGSGHEPRRNRGVRALPRAGPHVPGDAPHQLVPRMPHGAERPRGGQR